MTIAVWIASGLLAFAYLVSGASKAFPPQLANALTGMLGLRVVRTIGALELLGAIGLILPPLTGIVPILAGFAAAGLVLVQVGAIVTHIRMNELKVLPINVLLLLLAAFVAVARFMGY